MAYELRLTVIQTEPCVKIVEQITRSLSACKLYTLNNLTFHVDLVDFVQKKTKELYNYRPSKTRVPGRMVCASHSQSARHMRNNKPYHAEWRGSFRPPCSIRSIPQNCSCKASVSKCCSWCHQTCTYDSGTWPLAIDQNWPSANQQNNATEKHLNKVAVLFKPVVSWSSSTFERSDILLNSDMHKNFHEPV